MMATTVSTEGCLFMREYKQILITDFKGDFPATIIVKSHKTGREIECIVDRVAAIDNKFWGGNLIEYLPIETVSGFDKLVLTH